MAAGPQMSPQMMQMLAAGGQGGPGGGSPAQPQGGGSPQAAAIGRLLQGQSGGQGGSGDMEMKLLEQIQAHLGKVIQTVMQRNPKAYQNFLKAQMSIHSGLQELKSGAEDEQEHAQLTSSIMQLLQSTPGGGGSVAAQGPPGRAVGQV